MGQQNQVGKNASKELGSLVQQPMTTQQSMEKGVSETVKKQKRVICEVKEQAETK